MSSINFRPDSGSAEQKVLRTLMVEDSADDAELILNVLSRGGFNVDCLRVETAAAMQTALSSAPHSGSWDVILSEYHLPGFNAAEALSLWKTSRLNIPFIIVSGDIGEETAAALMNAGAHDFVPKGNMARLVPAVERSLLEMKTCRQFNLAQIALMESEAQFRAIAANIPGMVFQSIVKSDGGMRFPYVSDGCSLLLGIAPRTLQQHPDLFIDMVVAEDRSSFYRAAQMTTRALVPCNWEGRIRIGTQGEIKWVNLRASARRLPNGDVVWEGIVSNITHSKLAEVELKRAHRELGELTAHMQILKEHERARFAREIHDGLGSLLTAIKIDLLWLCGKLEPGQLPLLQKTKSIEALVDQMIDASGRIARDLRPGILDHGIVPAIRWQAREFQNRLGIACEIDCSEDIELEPHLSAAIFRIFQETLTNISKHANATRVGIRFRVTAGQAELSVSDNGCGMSQQDRVKSGSFGIRGMLERSRFLGGTVRIDSAPGEGTCVTASIPLIPNDADLTVSGQPPSFQSAYLDND